MNEHTHDGRTETVGTSGYPVRRRTLLATTALALAGCLGEDDEPVEAPDPVSLDEGQTCDSCGMVIEEHPGPNGEIFYEGDRPEGRDGPAWFCAIQCLNTYHAEKTRLGWEPIVTYVTDYSSVDYEITDREEGQYISSHPEADAFADADGVQVVTDTSVEGAMGFTPVPFSVSEDAEAFADEFDGTVVEWDAVAEG